MSSEYMDDAAPLLSAVILTWNSREYIGRCLDALAAATTGMAVEVFVVDNGSTDGTPHIVAAKAAALRFSDFQLIKLAANRGTTCSRNLAMRRGRGRYLLVLDSDTEIQRGAMEELIATANTTPRVGIVSPRLLASNGTTQAACKRFPTLRTKILKALPLPTMRRLGDTDELYPRALYEGAGVWDVDYCISAAWLINSSAVREVGLLDERIFYAPEDVDYCLRMWLHGWRVVYDPNAQVLHHTQRLSYRSLRMMGIHVRGLTYFFWKHRYLWSRDALYRRLSRETVGSSVSGDHSEE